MRLLIKNISTVYGYEDTCSKPDGNSQNGNHILRKEGMAMNEVGTLHNAEITVWDGKISKIEG